MAVLIIWLGGQRLIASKRSPRHGLYEGKPITITLAVAGMFQARIGIFDSIQA
jgi:hypothetical protein